MISVYKFAPFKTYKVDARVFTAQGIPNRPVKYSFIPIYRSKSNQMIVPVPKNIEVVTNPNTPYIEKINIDSLLNTVTDFTFEDKVYLHSDCTIPRVKVTQKYTRVLNPEKADICVVPTLKKENTTNSIAIFINRDKAKIYVVKNTLDYDLDKLISYISEKCPNFSLGSSVLDINPSLRGTLIEKRDFIGINNNTFSMENWKDFLDSTLLWYGPTLILYSKESWIADVLYNKLHDIITEDRLLATLGDSANEFTKEIYDNFKEMLKSSDKTVVGLGLKAVAEMDYEKYRNTTIHLLCNCGTNWTINKMISSSSVKYMLKYLGLWKSARERYATTTTQEDFSLMQEVINADFNKSINKAKEFFNLRFPFIKIDLSYQFTVSPKLKEETTLETEDNEFIELDSDF